MNRAARIILFASDPGEGRKMNISGEVREIERTLERYPMNELYTLKVIWNTSPQDLLDEISRFHPDILHFSGRGTARGIILHDKNNKCRLLDHKKLKYLLSCFKDDIRLIFLNSCFSSAFAGKILSGSQKIISVNGYADDAAAALFPGLFYRYSGYGYSEQKAVELAKTDLLIQDKLFGYDPMFITNKE